MAGECAERPAAEIPGDAARFTAWLDDALGRTLTIVALWRGSPEDAPEWRDALASYPGVRLLAESLGAATVAVVMARIVAHDPDVLLVCASDASAGVAEGWRADVLDVAEDRNLFERMLLARYGAGVTRASARKQGYEDGFSPEQSLADVLVILAREAIGRESYRRRGSSPPCYL